MPLENAMKNPRSMSGWCGVLNRGMVFVVLLYALMGFFGYLQYGDQVAGSVSLMFPPSEP